MARGYFRHNLPEELLARLDLGTLEREEDSFVDPELHPSASDLLLQARTLLADENGREIMFTLLYYLTEDTGRVNEKTLSAALDQAAPGGDMMKSFLKKYFDEGVQKGIQKGVAEGELRLLSRQLSKRFGDLPGWAEERLRKASSGMLEAWSERILTASTLDEVFSEQSG